jgi:hypothetical protein
VANTLAYYDTATITAVKRFIVQAPEGRDTESRHGKCRYAKCLRAGCRGATKVDKKCYRENSYQVRDRTPVACIIKLLRSS